MDMGARSLVASLATVLTIAVLIPAGSAYCQDKKEKDAKPATEQQTEEELAKRIDELLKNMAADEHKERKEAMKKLRNLLKESGEKKKALVKHLQKRFEESEDAEVRQRIEPILDLYLRPWKCFKKICAVRSREFFLSVAFSPDGKLLAAAGTKSAAIWDPRTGKCLHRLKEAARAVAFSPDGKLLASGSANKTIQIWDPDAGKLLRTLKGHACDVISIAFSADGKMLASCDVNAGGLGGETLRTVRIWDLQTGKCLRIIKGQSLFVAFSPDSKMLAFGQWHQNIDLRNPRTGASLRTFAGQKSAKQGLTFSLYSVAFSPDGMLACASSAGDDEGSVQIWNPSTGKCLYTFRYAHAFCSVAFSADGKLLAAAGGRFVVPRKRGGPVGPKDPYKVRIWDAQTRKCLRELEGHKDWVRAVAFSPDGKLLASGGHEGTVIIWGIPEVESKAEPQKQKAGSGKEQRESSGK